MRTNIETINEAAIHFLQPLTLRDLYKTIVDEAIKLVDGDEGLILIKEKKELKVSYTNSSKVMGKVRKKGFSFRSFQSKKAFVVHADEFRRVHPEIVKRGIKSSIFIPLSYRNAAIGVLVVRSYEDASFSTKELRVLKLFGTLASLAIAKTKLFDETQKAVEIRDIFISLVAHELRTPLTTINGYAQLLVHKTKNENVGYKKWIEELAWEAKRLTHLVSEFLEVNKVKSGQLEFIWKECNIREIIERSLSSFSFTYPKRKIAYNNTVKDNHTIIIGDL